MFAAADVRWVVNRRGWSAGHAGDGNKTGEPPAIHLLCGWVTVR
jgi:hypothetical protein